MEIQASLGHAQSAMLHLVVREDFVTRPAEPQRVNFKDACEILNSSFKWLDY